MTHWNDFESWKIQTHSKRLHDIHFIKEALQSSRIMFRRSLVVLSKRRPRTMIRDPRKKKLPAAVSQNKAITQQQQSTSQLQERQQMAFEPSQQNQQSIGSTMGSFAVAGFGVSLGFIFVGALFGGF